MWENVTVMAERDGARQAALRAYKSEWQRRKRRERKAAGVCETCGGARGESKSGTGDAYKGMCLTCTEAVRRREILQREAGRTVSGPVAGPGSGWRRKV